jgi:hypothetical protein
MIASVHQEREETDRLASGKPGSGGGGKEMICLSKAGDLLTATKIPAAFYISS